MDIVVAYDIKTIDNAGQRRLARVAATCERFGQRVQYSVFECSLSPLGIEKLVNELKTCIDESLDSVRIYQLRGSFEICSLLLGTQPPTESGSWIF